MGDDGAFGFDPEDFDWVIREAGDGLRTVFGRFANLFTAPVDQAGWGALFADLARTARSGPATTGETGDGVWVIHTADDDGAARVEEVYATEVDALRANQHNIDPRRKVRFLPYGITIGVLDGLDGAK